MESASCEQQIKKKNFIKKEKHDFICMEESSVKRQLFKMLNVWMDVCMFSGMGKSRQTILQIVSNLKTCVFI